MEMLPLLGTTPKLRITSILLAIDIAIQQFVFYFLITSLQAMVKLPPFNWTADHVSDMWFTIMGSMVLGYVLAGVLADSLIHRCWVIAIGHVFQLAAAIWVTCLSVYLNHSSFALTSRQSLQAQVVTVIGLSTIGSTLSVANVIAMGADQYRNFDRQSNRDGVARFIFGSVWLLNLGTLASVVVLNILFLVCHFVSAYVTALVSVIVGLLIFVTGWWRGLYIVVPARSILLCRIYHVIADDVRVRRMQRQLGGNPDAGFLNAARNDVVIEGIAGNHSVQEVESVKNIFKSLAILLLLLPYELGMRQLESDISSNLQHSLKVENCTSDTTVNLGAMLVPVTLDVLVILGMLPLLYLTIYFLRKHGIKTRVSVCMHIGMILGLVALVIACVDVHRKKLPHADRVDHFTTMVFWLIFYGVSRGFAKTAGCLLAYIWASRDFQGTIMGLVIANNGIAAVIIGGAGPAVTTSYWFSAVVAALLLVIIIVFPKAASKLDLQNSVIEADVPAVF